MKRSSSADPQVGLRFDPELEPDPAPLSGAIGGPVCLRRVPAREWRHTDWLSDAEVLAVICLCKNDRNCEGCQKMLLAKYRRRR